MSASAAAAEAWFSNRHRVWPPHLWAFDRDEHAALERRVMVEMPGGVAAVMTYEAKSVLAGPLDLRRPQFRAVAATCAPEVPCFVVQFTSPPVTDYLAVRLHPNNALAHRMFGSETPVLCERDFVLALDVLAHGRGQTAPLRPRRLTLTARKNDRPDICMGCGGRVRPREGRLVSAGAGKLLVVHAPQSRNDFGRTLSCWENLSQPLDARPASHGAGRLSEPGVLAAPEPLAALGWQTPDLAAWPQVTTRPGLLSEVFPRAHVESFVAFVRTAVEAPPPAQLAPVVAMNRPALGAFRTSDAFTTTVVNDGRPVEAVNGRAVFDAAIAARTVALAVLGLSDSIFAVENLSGGREIWADRYRR